MVKGHAKGSGSGRGNTPRIQRGGGQVVSAGSDSDKDKVGGEVRPLRLRVVPFGSCRINEKGYPRINSGKHVDEYLHRAVWEEVSGQKIPEGFQVHHMNFDKLCWCPSNLVAVGPGLHPPQVIRDPYTGEFLSRGAYARRYK